MTEKMIIPSQKSLRETLPEGSNICEHCNARCCRYYALPIDKPETYKEFDFVRWYLLHEKTSVFIDDGVWFLLVDNKCKNLGDDNRCMIYEKRPQICREYSNKKCEFENDFLYEYYFDNPDQIEEYAEAVLGPRPEKNNS